MLKVTRQVLGTNKAEVKSAKRRQLGHAAIAVIAEKGKILCATNKRCFLDHVACNHANLDDV
jgi:hypothetical protein